MINLIPKEEKKQMAKIFYYRLLILLFLVLGLSALVFFVAILPSYFLSSVKTRVANARLEEQKRQTVPMPDQETLLVIEDLDKKLNLLETARNNEFIFSEKVINAVISKKMREIKITDISYENDSVKGRTINIDGTAPNREILFLFRKALEDDDAFENVDLPISNFIQGANIQFNLTLTPS